MSDSELYSRLLFPKKQGYPLFYPQPSDDLPDLARRTGTEIGDVGVVTMYGGFDPIFNILRAADDPVNRRLGVPVGFEQIVLRPGDITALALYHRPGSDISSTTIDKRRLDIEAGTDNNVFLPLGVGATVEVSSNSKQAGLLLLPDGASRWDLRPRRVFRDYALRHTQNWYTFVNGDLGRMIGNGDLYLITGVTKSTSWSVAAVENQSVDGKVSLKLKAAQVGNAGASCAWEWESASSSVNSGPRRRLGEESWRDNQTVFLRGFKAAVRSTPLRRSPKTKSILNSKWSDISKTGSMPFSQPRPGPNSANNLQQSPPSTPDSGTSASDDEQLVDCLYHPSNVINEYLLDCDSGAVAAVVHDDEWASIMNEGDDRIPEPDELIRRICSKFHIDSAFGGVCLHDGDSETRFYTLSGSQEAAQDGYGMCDPGTSLQVPSPAYSEHRFGSISSTASSSWSFNLNPPDLELPPDSSRRKTDPAHYFVDPFQPQTPLGSNTPDRPSMPLGPRRPARVSPWVRWVVQPAESLKLFLIPIVLYISWELLMPHLKMFLEPLASVIGPYLPNGRISDPFGSMFLLFGKACRVDGNLVPQPQSTTTSPPPIALMILLGLAALLAGNIFPYTLLGLGAASLTVYAAHRQAPLYKLGRVEDAIIATEKIQRHAEADGARDQVQWMDYAKRLLDAKLSASKIQTRLFEARSVKTWGEYLEKVKEILQSIDECANEVKDIQTSILLIIEAERRRRLCEGINEVRETIDATIRSPMRHGRTLTLRRRFESEAGNTFNGPSIV